VYGYDAAGQQTSIWDGALGKQSTYAYDLAGRRIREVVVQGGVTYQDNHLSWDALGNLRAVADARVHMRMVYDKVGNRTRVTTTVDYQGVSGAASGSSDRFFRYDAMNRQTVVDAVDSSFNLGRQGHEITYDRNGNRKSDRWQVEGAGGVLTSTTEQYAYDAMNRLKTVSRGGVTIDTRRYDGASRVVQSGADGTLTAAQVAAMNQGVPAADAIGTDTRINRYDANGRLMHQKVLGVGMQAKSDLIWDPAETAGWSLPAAGYDAAGNTLGWSVRNWQSGPAIASYAVDLQRFEGYVGKTSAANGTMVIPVMTTQQYDANGFLVGVTDPSRAEGNRTFVNDSAGRALLVNQGGRVQRQLVVNGEVLGIYGVGLDPTAIGQVGGNASFANVADFNFGYSKVTGAYPSATPGAYHVRPGDTLQSIAHSAYGDSKLWYRIADANGLASSSELKVGQTLNIPSGVGTISNNAGTFKPYDAARITGDLNPLALPPAGRDADCGGMGKLVMVAIAVAVTAATGGAGGAINSFWTSFFNSTLGCTVTSTAVATAATAATAAAVGSIASQAVGMMTGDVATLDWKGVALSAISAGITQGLSGTPELSGARPVTRAALGNAITQGVGVLTGLQQRFDWRGVAASALGSAVGERVGEALGLNSAELRSMTPAPELTFKSALKSFAAGLTSSMARGGRVAIQQVATDAFGTALGNLLVPEEFINTAPPPLLDIPEIAPAPAPRLGLESNRGRSTEAGLRFSDQLTETNKPNPELDEIGAEVAGRILSFATTAPSAVSTHVAQSGGHYFLVGLIGRALGIPDERLGKIMMFSQLPDQISATDAYTNGVRYYVTPGDYAPKAAGVRMMEALHALNGMTVARNVAIYTEIIRRNLSDDAVIGIALHGLVDSFFHSKVERIGGKEVLVTFKSPMGHGMLGSSPDYINEQQVKGASGAVIEALQLVSGKELGENARIGVMNYVTGVVERARSVTDRQDHLIVQGRDDPSWSRDQRMELNFREVSTAVLGSSRSLNLLQPREIESPATSQAITRELTIRQVYDFISTTRVGSASMQLAETIADQTLKAAERVVADFENIAHGDTPRHSFTHSELFDSRPWSLRAISHSAGELIRWSIDALTPSPWKHPRTGRHVRIGKV
jgi:YD repeat-containing protein